MSVLTRTIPQSREQDLLEALRKIEALNQPSNFNDELSSDYFLATSRAATIASAAIRHYQETIEKEPPCQSS
jgi:hypothetical protein